MADPFANFTTAVDPDPAAMAWQSRAMVAGDLLIWTVCESPADHPGKFTARPHSSKAGAPCDFVLIADSLEALRDMLPPELHRMPRHATDPAVVVETWM